jgi:hypothetical protein
MRRFRLFVKVLYLQIRNLAVRTPCAGHLPVVVCLTTYGRRARWCHLTIESIAAGTARPQRLILWVDEVELVRRPTRPIKRLQRRGLEVLPTPDWGPHKKYYPYVQSRTSHHVPLATADDDVIYPRWWLETLFDAGRGAKEVTCFRAHVMRIGAGAILPYTDWHECRTSEPSYRHVATGVSGVLYPESFLNRLRIAGDEFVKASPTADDLWLHASALRSGYRTRQVSGRPWLFDVLPINQGKRSLWYTNVARGGNDRQIARMYGPQDLARLRADELYNGGLRGTDCYDMPSSQAP